jgi:hypothetical protein
MSSRKGLFLFLLAVLIPAAMVSAVDFSSYWVGSNKANWDNALAVGTDADGSPLYVIRAYNKDKTSLVPGKYNPGSDTAYICYGGKEVVVAVFEVLVLPPKIAKKFQWVHVSEAGDGEPVPGGYDSDGSDLYVIAADCGQATMTPGKFNPNHETAYVPYGGKEVVVEDFYFLVYK